MKEKGRHLNLGKSESSQRDDLQGVNEITWKLDVSTPTQVPCKHIRENKNDMLEILSITPTVQPVLHSFV